MAFPVTLNGRTYTLTDFEGTNYVDGLPDAFEDFVTHAGDIYNSTSTTSNSIGTGSKTFTVEANKPYQAGTPLRIADAAAPSTNFLDTVVTSYSGTTLVVNSIGFGGSGTKTSWTVNIGGAKTVDGTLGLSQGGTGATDAAGARTNIDVYSKADADSRFLNVSGEASDVTMNGNTTIGDASSDTLTVNATSTFNSPFEINDTDDTLAKLISTASSASIGARLTLTHNKTAADGDVAGYIDFNSNNDSAAEHLFSRIQVDATDVSSGDEDSRLRLFTLVNGVTFEGMRMSLGTVFNENGVDADFRVESDSNTHALFVDAANDRVGIGQNAPTAAGLEIKTIVNNTYSDTIPYQTHTGDSLVIFNTPDSGGDDYVAINMLARGAQTSAMRHIVTSPGGGDTDYIWQFRDSADTNNTTKRMIYTSDGSLRYFPLASTETAFNEDGVNHDFRVESDGNTHMLFVDAASNAVWVGTNERPTSGVHSTTTLYSQSATNVAGFKTTAIANNHTALGLSRATTAGKLIEFNYNDTTQVGSVSITASATSYNTTSDRRLKDNIEPIADGTEKLMAMNPISHKWIAEPEADAVHGFIAQEMQDIIPEAVSGDPDGEEMMSMDYGRITPVLVAALQDAHKKIETLEARITALESN